MWSAERRASPSPSWDRSWSSGVWLLPLQEGGSVWDPPKVRQEFLLSPRVHRSLDLTLLSWAQIQSTVLSVQDYWEEAKRYSTPSRLNSCGQQGDVMDRFTETYVWRTGDTLMLWQRQSEASLLCDNHNTWLFRFSRVICTSDNSEIWDLRSDPREKNESWQFKFWNFWISLEVKYSFYLWHICSWADKVNLWLTIQTNSKTKTGSTSEYFWEGKN